MPTSYEDLLEHNPKLADVTSKEIYDNLITMGDRTVEKLGDIWFVQMKKNVKHLYKKHGLLIDNCNGFGSNKAVIIIGAGPSFNLNKKYLLKLCQYNAQFEFKDQPFLFIATNHQFKPCLEMGIIPHFCLVCDASDTMYDQLCVDIPQKGQAVTLICAIHAHPRVLNEWDNQGRLIQFYITGSKRGHKFIKKFTGEDVAEKKAYQGGNIMNTGWVIALSHLNTKVVMVVGNDLSYPLQSSIEKQRKTYYADGDYSTNACSRDEASAGLNWMGFGMSENIFTQMPETKLKLMGTSRSLFNYKLWLEVNIGIQDLNRESFHYYNCSEAGILGVISRGFETEEMRNKDYWYLLDELFPKRYHTRTLKDAAIEFLAVWRMKWEMENGRGVGATLLHQSMGSVSGAARLMI